MSRPKARTVTGAAKQAGSTVGDAQQQALDAIRDARKQARRQLVRARVAAARTRAGTQAKASKGSMKAVGVAGAAGLAAGYFLDPDSGKRRRHVARERALALIRRGAEPAADDQAPAEPVKSESGKSDGSPGERVT
ncbi:MAG TPA: hypothetical protein VGJ61_11775 [Solirubrobacterales bacterium]